MFPQELSDIGPAIGNTKFKCWVHSLFVSNYTIMITSLLEQLRLKLGENKNLLRKFHY